MPVLAHCPISSTLHRAKPPFIRCGGKIVHCNVLTARAITLAAGVPTDITPGAKTLLVS
jgi:hypothetical protein